ncbi:hypothetical protein BX285_6974 [Streptomyces sp. 1114.5]|uniref:hypothetical protein n=1 Tax=Streptomyces sp. 1114.5 TaxID=1938830 RepID=UPI000F0D6565|nr:hypothetical protein [Streptomyces sp. 1114.5]RKT09861.1 hypothetical protein BX285_6974 [Streptomyces sp. 1114.5]
MITITVFLDRSPDVSGHHNDVPCAVPGDMVAVGGGATGTDTPSGALLTASYPNADASAWLASSADHIASNPHTLEVYAIGMKIKGMSRADLLHRMNYSQVESSSASRPNATLGPPPPGYTLISGGFRVNGPANLATASFPSQGVLWKVASKDHIVPSPCSITAFAISVQTNLPIGNVECFIRSQTSSEEAHPSATVEIPQDCALTGIGAETLVASTDPGQLLWHLRPIENGARVASQDHTEPSPGKITASALGIRIVAPS